MASARGLVSGLASPRASGLVPRLLRRLARLPHRASRLGVSRPGARQWVVSPTRGLPDPRRDAGSDRQGPNRDTVRDHPGPSRDTVRDRPGFSRGMVRGHPEPDRLEPA